MLLIANPTYISYILFVTNLTCISYIYGADGAYNAAVCQMSCSKTSQSKHLETTQDNRGMSRAKRLDPRTCNTLECPLRAITAWSESDNACANFACTGFAILRSVFTRDFVGALRELNCFGQHLALVAWKEVLRGYAQKTKR